MSYGEAFVVLPVDVSGTGRWERDPAAEEKSSPNPESSTFRGRVI